ncbi:MAG: carboxylesterase family protein [Woeseia sp.]
MKHAGRRSLPSLFLVACLAQSAAAGAQETNEPEDSSQLQGPLQVKVAQGVLEGFEPETGVIAFRGIPFAAPPVGELRWKPPVPPAAWGGVRLARAFGPDCMQFARNPYTVAVSEDCLHLNVYKPADAQPGDDLPVHVWIPPGAYFMGAASDPAYNTNMGDVRDGIVYVNLNYRLNAFGFIAHPDLTAESPHGASGNYGLIDQVAALEWVRDNIRRFGGDPAQVTVSGVSAGAASIGYLLTSPMAKDLFKRALIQSAAAWHPQRTLAQQEEWSVARFGSDIAELRSKPADEILAMTAVSGGNADGTDTLGDGRSGPFSYIDWLPIVDGYVLPKSDRQAWKDGDFKTVEIMIGDNENEGLMFIAHGAPIPLTKAAYEPYMLEEYGALGSEALEIYSVAADADVPYQLGMATGDTLFGLASREMGRRMARRTPNVYRYLFTRHHRQTEVAIHADEVPYFFGNVTAGEKYDETDVALSKIMQGAKRRFIKTGNPNGGKMRNWPAYEQDDPFIEFGNNGMTPGSGHRNAALDFAVRTLDARFPLGSIAARER